MAGITAILPACGRPRSMSSPSLRFGPSLTGIGGVKPVGQAQEDLFEVAPLVGQLVEHDLVLSGQRAEPLGGGPVDDHRVGATWRKATGTAWRMAASRGSSGVRTRRPGVGSGPAAEVGQRGLEHQPPVGDDDHVVDGLLHLREEVRGDEHGMPDWRLGAG